MTGGIPTGLLSDLLVLDVTNDLGLFAGRMLGELGADVIRVEPPAGSEVRARQPFLDGERGIERSLYHLHFNVNKRGITLDLTQPRGIELYRHLAQRADVILETFPPGEADARGIGYEQLRELQPSLVYTTITPFGQEGPMRDYRANDLIGVASSGLMWLNGFPEDPPTMPGSEQAYHMASLVAASSTLIAVHDRDRRGVGHRIDVSMQEAASMATLQHASANAYTWQGQVPGRKGLQGLRGGRSIFQCADGLWVSFMVPAYRWEEFVEWLGDEQIDCELFADTWRDFAFRVQHGGRISEVIDQLVSRYPREHIFHEGQRRRLLVMRSNNVANLVEDEQLAARDFFVELEHETFGRTLVDTGVAYQFSKTPASVRRRAPLLGEHNDEVYGELLGLTPDEFAEGLALGPGVLRRQQCHHVADAARRYGGV